VTVSELLFPGGLAAVFRGLLTSSRLTAYRRLCAPRTAQLRYCAPISRLHDSYSSFDLEPPGFLRVTKKPEEVLWAHSILKMYLKSALVLRSLHSDSSTPIIHSLISQPSSSLHLKSSSFSRALVATVVPSSLSQSSFHPP
jgi:hypothetical protein